MQYRIQREERAIRLPRGMRGVAYERTVLCMKAVDFGFMVESASSRIPTGQVRSQPGGNFIDGENSRPLRVILSRWQQKAPRGRMRGQAEVGTSCVASIYYSRFDECFCNCDAMSQHAGLLTEETLINIRSMIEPIVLLRNLNHEICLTSLYFQ